MKSFFISYTSEDTVWAQWIARELEAAGYSTIIQAWDFRPGENFVVEMHKAASDAERTLLVLSEDYLKSQFAQSEWAAAFARDPTGAEGRIVPVRVKPCKPGGLLGAIAYIDLVDLEKDAAREKLLDGVRPGARARWDSLPEPPMPPSLPPRQRFVRMAIAYAIVTSLVLVAAWVGLLSAIGADDWMEGRFLAHMQRFLPSPASDDVILVRGKGDGGPLGKPGPDWRGAHAELIDAMSKAGVRVIVFDLDFTDLNGADQRLADAIRGAAALGTRVVVGALDFEVIDGTPTPRISGVLAGVRELRWGTLRGDAALRRLELAQRLERRTTPFLRVDAEPVVPSLALQAVMQALAGPGGRAAAVFNPRAEVIEIRATADQVLRSIPVDSHLGFIVDVKEDFPPHGYAEIHAQRDAPEALRGFRGKVVVVGFETPEEVRPGPAGKTRYEMDVQASAIAQMLGGSFLQRPSAQAEYLMILAMAAVGWLLRAPRGAGPVRTLTIPLPGRLSGFVRVPTVLLAAVPAYGLIAFVVCKEMRIVLRFTYDLLALLLTFWAVGRAARGSRRPVAAAPAALAKAV